MASADILVSLIKSAKQGDMISFQKTAETLIAEERAKKHIILADRLAQILNNGYKGPTHPAGNKYNEDLIFERVPQKTMEDLVLEDDVTQICREICEEQHRAELLRAYGIEPRNRVLLAGSPGNGKTSLAEALAASLMYPLFIVRYENLIGSYLGETTSRLQRVFEYARTRNCVLFFDEFDTIGKERGDTHETGEIKRVVSTLLLQVDRLPSYVVIITASNHPELLDKAVWRRFQIRLELRQPGVNSIRKYLEFYFSGKKIKLNYSLDALAAKLMNLSFAEIEEFCTTILRQAVLTRKQDDTGSIVQQELLHLSNRFSVSNAEDM